MLRYEPAISAEHLLMGFAAIKDDSFSSWVYGSFNGLEIWMLGGTDDSNGMCIDNTAVSHQENLCLLVPGQLLG
jgi:hypothetical protein